MRRIHVVTYGCQMNVHDSEMILGVLQAAGHQVAPSIEEADVVLLNTCCVREKPERKVLSKVAELKRMREQQRPELIIGVCGCMAQSLQEELFSLAPAVDLASGPDEIGRLPELVAAVEAGERHVSAMRLGHTRPASDLPKARSDDLQAWVTIMHGCTNRCSYCIVPDVRGPERSRPIGEIREEVAQLVASQVREVTLLGQNVNAYGMDLPPGSPRFPRLLAELDGIAGLARIRFTTSHPKDFGDDLIEAVAGLPRVCEHVHLPVQAGSDEVLARMNRRYTRDQYLALVDRIRAAIPDVSITTDVMVGFPGETDAQFEQTLDVFERVRFDQAFMFIFSPRRGTRAERMADPVPREVKRRRLERLSARQNEIAREKNQTHVGRAFEVLVEGPSARDPSRLSGRTRTNKIAVFGPLPGRASPARGRFVWVRVTRGYLWGYEAEVIDTACHECS
ncbi:MAG TPA: tRNA (N6-isopentenyl adenosine(37)-C2)-methylthiotransferase MiaB [Armatimonadota bacterium]|nr:tRNA (N6-isopentenyl adenosine(37)-C2)-methylthiotransferase MiaB [Armatimonadota bacterium]HQK91887.1 tRNA (N6-isopentenyl adenosine(37)-C2)-methylthiotransferase MiaB [Armatimonadota bacterium]